MRVTLSVQSACVLALCATAAFAEPGLFSSSGLDGWSEQPFKDKKPTQYRLVRETNVQVLEADCKQVHVVALRSGPADAGRWMEERRDVRADLKRYFGLDAAHIDGVALMTDCDDAGGATRAWYGDVRLEKALQ